MRPELPRGSVRADPHRRRTAPLLAALVETRGKLSIPPRRSRSAKCSCSRLLDALDGRCDRIDALEYVPAQHSVREFQIKLVLKSDHQHDTRVGGHPGSI